MSRPPRETTDLADPVQEAPLIFHIHGFRFEQGARPYNAHIRVIVNGSTRIFNGFEPIADITA